MTETNLWERVLVRIDSAPWDGIYRTFLGYLLVPVGSIWGGETPSGSAVIVTLIAMLVVFRIGPASLRKALPFPARVTAIWAERRQTAKRYDSYQWRKLFYIGAGMLLYALSTGTAGIPTLSVAAFCLLSGAAGWVRWWKVTTTLRSRLASNAEHWKTSS